METPSTPDLLNQPCEAVGNRCGLCVQLAGRAMNRTLVAQGLSDKEAGSLVEHAFLPALVEEQSGVSLLECAQRRERAARIGQERAVSVQDDLQHRRTALAKNIEHPAPPHFES
jgi:hypothetical protein